MEAQQKSEYLLLFRGTDWHGQLSPEEIQNVTSRMKEWFDRLTSEGKLASGKPLMAGGKIVSQKKGRLVADGPFAETKEAIGGYFLIRAGSLDEAAVMARDFPALDYGATVEVRAVAAECELSQRIRQVGSEPELVEATA